MDHTGIKKIQKQSAGKVIKLFQVAEYEMKIMELKEICWDRTVKEAVWKKGQINPDYSPHVLRWDKDGRIMMWTKFGRTDSRFGWTIKAIEPLGEKGLDNLDNLQPVSTYSPNKKYKKDMESPSTGG